MNRKGYLFIRERLEQHRLLFIPVNFFIGCFRRIIHEFSLLMHRANFAWSDKESKDGLPLPPPKLRYRVHGELRASSFLKAGNQVYADISRVLDQHQVVFSERLKMLDFGCGCARILRYFFRDHEIAAYTGTDVDAEAIAWNRSNYPDHAAWDVNDSKPPLKYADESFDVVVANSVFTHLSEELQFAWLQEIGRVLTPDGIAICSVHGESIWNAAAASNAELKTAMEEAGYYFLMSNIGVRNMTGLPGFYQTAFHSDEYVRREWGSYLQVVDYVDRDIGGYQAAVVLRKA